MLKPCLICLCISLTVSDPISIESTSASQNEILEESNLTQTIEQSAKENILLDQKDGYDELDSLILTKFLEQNDSETAKKLSKVDPEILLGYGSYSGFLTVEPKHNSNLFFWYIPTKEGRVEDRPLIIWLQGGPGASSLSGLFLEMGPIIISENLDPILNEYTWVKNNSVIFIDSPVGTGFSFTNEDGYAKDIETVGRHLYRALEQLLQIYPELQRAQLYLAGESYAGKFVPALAMEILNHKKESQIPPNLQGIILGNPFIELKSILHISRIVYMSGLADLKYARDLQYLERAIHNDIKENKPISAKRRWRNLVQGIMYITSQESIYSYLNTPVDYGNFLGYLNKSKIRNSIHVGQRDFVFVSSNVNDNLVNDFIKSSKPMLERLLNENYRVICYLGQVDMMVSYVLSSEMYSKMVWNKSKQFVQSARHPWMIGKNELAGYHKSGGGFTEVLVLGAGHMAPQNKPKQILDLVTRFTRNETLKGYVNEIPFKFMMERIPPELLKSAKKPLI